MEHGQALKIVQSIQEELRINFFQTIKQSVTFSAGLLQFDNGLYAKFEYTDLINCVDKLLYQAKKRRKKQNYQQ